MYIKQISHLQKDRSDLYSQTVYRVDLLIVDFEHCGDNLSTQVNLTKATAVRAVMLCVHFEFVRISSYSLPQFVAQTGNDATIVSTWAHHCVGFSCTSLPAAQQRIQLLSVIFIDGTLTKQTSTR